jgi:hypothetical protein
MQDTVLFNQTSYGTSGSIQSTLPNIYLNDSVVSHITVDDTLVSVVKNYFGPIIDYNGVNIFIELLMFSSLVLLFIAHPIMIVIGGLVGIFASFALISMGTGNFGVIISSIVYYIIAGIIIMWQIGRRM